ncbi:MAG: GatB/YqeY domain-containing protein [Devosia sp.]|uniref:GatB/YqeY domain-containing protein n=1 Tax=Devosia sp. TaxID=1871048 RepID=UPI001AC8DFA2|nr:GatB/YqeY domain-containing protein [Devosia sp.]MBN9316476.1 GatB/YqeY domain-containing protein [Devosia sp.]
MREAISEGYKAALKAGDKRRTATLRAINAAIKDKEIDARGQGKEPLNEQDVLALLQKMVKQREESLGIYEKAGREDLAVVEREEIAILNEFLPKGLSEAEVEAAIIDAIRKTGAEGAKDMGKVVAALKAEFPGRIDFGKASAKIRTALGA